MKRKILGISLSQLLMGASLLAAPSSGKVFTELQKLTLSESEQVTALQRAIDQEREEGRAQINSLKEIACAQSQEISQLQDQLSGPSNQSCNCFSIFDALPPIDESRFTLVGDYLLWRTLENQTLYVTHDQPTSTDTAAIGEMLSANFDWDSGFRLKAGYCFAGNFWELDATYTYFKNSGSDQISGNDIAPVRIVLSPVDITNNSTAVTSAKSSLNLSYNTLDLLLGKRILLDRDFILTFAAGATAAWIHQSFSTHYLSTDLDTHTQSSFHFNGWGLKSALTNDWYIGKGFSFFSQLGFAALVGGYRSDQTLTEDDSTDPIFTQRKSHLHQSPVAFNAQFQLGPCWSVMKKDWGLTIKTEYEINPWFNLFLVDRSAQSIGSNGKPPRNTKGVLCPQGLTTSLTLTF